MRATAPYTAVARFVLMFVHTNGCAPIIVMPRARQLLRPVQA
jgi:hypothetical protein